MTRVIVGAIVLAATMAPATAQRAPDRDRVPVLVELFTSEGCNSCPPADRILEMLSHEQPIDGAHIVTLSEHVTYWDHQGWRDPFGSPRFTERQNTYTYRFNIDGAFTPQAIVDGTTQMVGSDTAQLKNALAGAARTPKPALTIEIASAAANEIVASASGPGLAAGAGDRVDLLWALTEDNLVVDVKRGENANRTLRHSGVVRTLLTQKLDGQQKQTVTLRLSPEWKREQLRVVAFVQSSKSRRVLSVGWRHLEAR